LVFALQQALKCVQRFCHSALAQAVLQIVFHHLGVQGQSWPCYVPGHSQRNHCIATFILEKRGIREIQELVGVLFAHRSGQFG